MAKKTFQIPNIGCEGCVNTVESELKVLPGVKTVAGKVESKLVTVEWDDPASWQQIVETLTEIDYAPAGA